jgi:DNA-directed RNA polymerase subunit K/omega
MRSEYVFAAAKEISNRFLLCRIASVSARRLQVGSKHTSETINQSLQLIATAELTEPNQQGNTSLTLPG